jgi:outer membrane protein assembly factor BamA
VDRLRLGIAGQLHPAEKMLPRVGGRLEYSFGRERTLYGVRFEQPLIPDDWLSLGFSMDKRTAHYDLQHIPDWENSLDLFFGRIDNRDYFETEGFGGGISSRLGDVTTLSIEARNDDYRTLPAKGGITSIFWTERELRPNPAIDDGESRTLGVELERLRRRKVAPRAGIYHYLSMERSGYGMGGDFEYTRLLGDVRTVMRLSPATTLALRLVGGATVDGVLPAQRAFTLGGVDALRAHNTATLRGNQVALGQAEYTIGLWQLKAHDWMDGGLNLIAFVDAGTAWEDADGHWDVGGQRFEVDGGFGIGTDDDGLRVYFARNLHEPSGGFNVTARLQRPF